MIIHLPTVIGLIVCEQVIVEKETNNLSLINCFIRRKVSAFPSDPQKFAVVAFMTDGSGTIPMELTITESETFEIVERQSVAIAFPSRLHEVRFLFRWTECVFPAEGEYDICLLTRDALLAQHRIHVG